jgi:hypothetical protein
MRSRLNDRLKHLEARISPKPPSRVFTLVIDDGGLSHDEQVEAVQGQDGRHTARSSRRDDLRLTGSSFTPSNRKL